MPLRTVPGAHPLPPYVRLIHDVLLGDRSLFTRPDGLEHVWQVAGALLADKPEPVIYPKGSWGPAKADRLAEPIGWLLSPGPLHGRTSTAAESTVMSMAASRYLRVPAGGNGKWALVSTTRERS
ncbi:MAG TPA: hypothetical protein VE196_14750 [Pseudonocardiaceae bacterium]|nr:hypothetical protein [Pseudonocardiaceae bacterium]